MDFKELDAIAQSGAAKYLLCRQSLSRYLTRSVLAGFYLSLGLFASHICAALFLGSAPAVGKVLSAAIFGVGLISIVMLGGELFTGNNFVLSVAALERRVPLRGVAQVWGWCYLGNLIGSILICSFFVWGGSMNALLTPYLKTLVQAKFALSIPQLLFRGILCNFVVCAGVLAGSKIQDATAKVLVIGMLIFTFIIAGYEHSVANMGVFTLAFWLLPGVSLAAMLRNLLWVTLGNILGGGLMLALPYWYACGRGESARG